MTGAGASLRVSAVIPTHRRADLLSDAIGSVLAQERLPIEVVVVDDADDAATRDVVAAIATDAAIPLRIVANHANPGACNSRNAGARAAVGDWIAYLDDDDIWRPGFVARLTDALAGNDADFALSGILRHEAGHAPVPRAMAPGLTPATLFDQPASMTGSNCILRKDVLATVGGFDAGMAVFNDWDLFIRLIDGGHSYVVVPDVLAEWREHPGQRIATPSLRRADGLDTFLARYGTRLSDWQRRDLKTTALGIRRWHERSRLGRLVLTARLALAHGPARVARWLRGRRLY